MKNTCIKLCCFPGVSPGKWVDRWRERFTTTPLVVEPLQGNEAVADIFPGLSLQAAVEASAEAGSEVGLAANASPEASPRAMSVVALLRLPLDETLRGSLHAIPLYEESPEVVMPRDCILTALDEVSQADLLEICSGDDAYPLLTMDAHLPSWAQTHAGWFGDGVEAAALTPDTFEDAMEAVANGAGLMVLPQSVAREVSRKDVVRRPFTGIEPTRIALVWPRDDDSWQAAEFVGVVRGRTAQSSRGTGEAQVPSGTRNPQAAQKKTNVAKTKPAKTKPAKAKPGAGTGRAGKGRSKSGGGGQGGPSRPTKKRGSR